MRLSFYSIELSAMCELAFECFENSLSRLKKPSLPGPSVQMMNQVLANFYMILKKDIIIKLFY